MLKPHSLILPLLVGLLGACPGIMYAQEYPDKPLRIVLPGPPGGGTDTIARIVGPNLAEAMGRPVVIDNRAGAAGNLATEIVARSAPDGYNLLLGVSVFLTVNPLLYKLSFDVLQDLAPVIYFATAQNVLVVHASVPAKSVQELIVLAKAKPGQLNYGSSGSGSPLHLAAELFNQRAATNIVHVPYKGGAPAAVALLASEVQVLFGSFASTLPYLKSGKIRALAVTGATRSFLMPELPTIAESGLPGYDVTNWYGILVRERTPRAIVSRLNAEMMRLLTRSPVRESLLKAGVETTGSTPEKLGQMIRDETAVWAKDVKDAGIKAE